MARNRSVLLALAALGPALISWGCNSGGNALPGTGGTPGTGGAVSSGGISGTGGLGTSCPNVTACGGNLVGTWTVTSSCLNVTGNLDLALVGAGCPSAPVTGSLQVTGTWTANADGTYSDDTLTSGSEQFTLGPSCPYTEKESSKQFFSTFEFTPTIRVSKGVIGFFAQIHANPLIKASAGPSVFPVSGGIVLSGL
jgi:hypothetical protein